MCSQVVFSLNSTMQCSSARAGHRFFFPGRRMNTEIPFRRIDYNTGKSGVQRGFPEDSRAVLRPRVQRINGNPKVSFVSASLITGSQIASSAFTLGTVAVLPFYTLMVFVPNSTLTKRVMDSNIPFVSLAILYGCLVYLSWTPSTLTLLFASKYWLPELPGITKMFASDMTLSSAWIHFLVVDLYAARQLFLDGLKNKVETRHTVILCLLCCPFGILTHLITKEMTKIANAPN